jgi:hypothetical protein
LERQAKRLEHLFALGGVRELLSVEGEGGPPPRRGQDPHLERGMPSLEGRNLTAVMRAFDEGGDARAVGAKGLGFGSEAPLALGRGHQPPEGLGGQLEGSPGASLKSSRRRPSHHAGRPSRLRLGTGGRAFSSGSAHRSSPSCVSGLTHSFVRS